MDDHLIATVNALQQIIASVGGDALDLPQLVVCGSQSSGKSSVLETIVGKDFLPRGSGIVTRRPLVLQLVHFPGNQPGEGDAGPSVPTREFGEFLHVDKRFYDFADIRKEIELETQRVTGQNKGISRLPIHLKIYSPRVLNLTLVDLPGLTRIPVGDQPSDIERQIRSLVLDFISKPNCIILAISPANVDLANSDSLKLARSVDPQGRRTIGVLTKLDLMDAGTNAVDVLTGRVYPLKLGFTGVVNRSQQDILANKPLDEAIDAEADFFRTHPAYRNIAHRCGTRYLAKTLNQVLTAHIRDKLPDMKARLNTLMGQTQQELNAYGDSTFLGEQHRGSLILKLMTQFVRDFVASIDGTALDISTKELCGGARIYYIFHDVFGHALESINPEHNLTVQDIRTAIRNSTGPKPSLFVPEVAFDLLVKPQIALLEPPSLRCVELVYEELMKICHNCTSSELQRYPRLHARLVETVSELLRERLGPTSDYVQSLIAIQGAYINTNHPAFMQSTGVPVGETFAGNGGRDVQHESSINDEGDAAWTRDGAAKRSADSDDANRSSEADDDGDGPVNGPELLLNGTRAKSHVKKGHTATRSTSSSTTSRPQSGHPAAATRSTSAAATSSSAASVHGASAKDSFLNYFFGGPAALGAGSSSGARRAALPDVGGRPDARSDNPLSGRRGLEGTAAAFDMKSLEKHLDTGDATPALTGREEMETALIRSLIASYFGIVRQQVADLVPKAVMHCLVNTTRDTIQNRLVATLYKETLFPDLLQEDESLTQERDRLKALLDAYRAAHKTLGEGI